MATPSITLGEITKVENPFGFAEFSCKTNVGTLSVILESATEGCVVSVTGAPLLVNGLYVYARLDFTRIEVDGEARVQCRHSYVRRSRTHTDVTPSITGKVHDAARRLFLEVVEAHAPEAELARLRREHADAQRKTAQAQSALQAAREHEHEAWGALIEAVLHT